MHGSHAELTRIGLRAVERGGLRHGVLAYGRIFVRGYFVGEHVGDTAHRKLHIALTGAKKHIAAEHVVDGAVVDGDDVGASGLERGQFEGPVAEAVGADADDLGLAGGAAGGDGLAGVGGAPELHGLVALHHHAVAQYGGQLHLGLGGGRCQGCYGQYAEKTVFHDAICSCRC